MNAAACVIGGLLLLVLAGLAWCYLTAPYGWEDETGFHRGRKP